MQLSGKIKASIVTYNSNSDVLSKSIASLLESKSVQSVVILDNSPEFPYSELKRKFTDDRLEFRSTGGNLGYGKAHNIAIRESLDNGTEYHLVINPDVYFDPGTLESIYDFLEKHMDIGLLMPDVHYPDGSRQYLSKLLPTPLDLILRRFIPFKSWKDKRTRSYELHDMDFSVTYDIPYLSGCFMMLRTSIVEKVGLFDERFFMYFEDTDLTRRFYNTSRSVYFPGAKIYHEYGKTSYKNIRVLRYHIVNAIRYFNKWGWFFDQERFRINRAINKRINEQIRNNN